MCDGATLGGLLGECRASGPRTQRLQGCRVNGLGVFLATFLLCFCSLSQARSAPRLADYCPPDPAAGQLSFKSVDSVNSACTPGAHDELGLAVFQCWQQFVIEVNGCQVLMRTTADQLVGPGKLPCRMFGISGNLTGEGIEAQMWADVDGPALLSYYSMEPEAVAALRYDNSRQLVADLWAFLRYLTGDLRFDDVDWINQAADQYRAQAATANTDAADAAVESYGSSSRSSGFPQPDLHQQQQQQEAELDEQQSDTEERLQQQQLWRRRQQLAAAAGGVAGGASVDGARGRLVVDSAARRDRHGPMRVYRTSETRVVVKAPTGCKYRYTLNPTSRVFDSPARHHAHVAWRTILLTVATLSVVLAVVGLGTCTYFSHRHAEYVSNYWEYQAVKDQLGSELPPNTYIRLFGEQPKSAAAAAAATAAALAAARNLREGGSAAAAAKAAAAAAAPPPSPPLLLSPAVVQQQQQDTSTQVLAEAGGAPAVGTVAGEADGITSPSSSSSSSLISGEIDAAGDIVIDAAVAATAPVAAADAADVDAASV